MRAIIERVLDKRQLYGNFFTLLCLAAPEKQRVKPNLHNPLQNVMTNYIARYTYDYDYLSNLRYFPVNRQSIIQQDAKKILVKDLC